MPKARFHPLLEWLTGKTVKIVFRRSHNGKLSTYPSPDMTGIEWSQAQKAQRQKMARATAYGQLAIQDPEIRQFYVEMAKQRKKNERRPFDMAVSDYHDGNDLLWKKHYGDQEKPADWSWKDAQLPSAPVAGT